MIFVSKNTYIQYVFFKWTKVFANLMTLNLTEINLLISSLIKNILYSKKIISKFSTNNASNLLIQIFIDIDRFISVKVKVFKLANTFVRFKKHTLYLQVAKSCSKYNYEGTRVKIKSIKSVKKNNGIQMSYC